MSKEPNRNVYVGHRYVPKIFGEWDKKNEYEGLSIVTHKGGSYTSKKRVPVGIDILNEEFWVITGNYDAQVEYYRDETERVAQDLLLKADKSYTDTELGKKADKSYTDTELGKKADKSYTDTELGKKANQTYVDTELGKKSDQEYVDTELDKKSNQTYVDTELDKKSNKTYVDNEFLKDRKRLDDNEIDLNDRSLNAKKFGLVLDGQDETDLFQEFIDYCKDNNITAFAKGTLTISKRIDIQSNFDFSQLEIISDHNGTALFIGNELSNAPESGFGSLPKLRQKNKERNQSVGVMLKNLNRWSLHLFNEINDFGVGLKLTAQNYGTAYNNIYWNSIINNKINIELYATYTGWVNENKFFGGSSTHTTDLGMQLQGYHALKIHCSEDSPYLPDNNIFYSPSLEGSVPYDPVYIHGQQNYIYSGRYEAHGGQTFRVRFKGFTKTPSVNNGLLYGYGVGNLDFIEDINAMGNIRLSTATLQSIARSDRPSLKVKNMFDPTSNIIEVGDPFTDDRIVIAGDRIETKNNDEDLHPRYRLRTDGRLFMGDGTEPAQLKMSNSDLGVRFDNGLSIANSRWSDNTLRMGQYHIWVTSTGHLRIKLGKPTSDDDGKPVSQP